MTPSTSRSNTFILLFYLLFPFIHASCPKKCANGYNVRDCKCESNCYRETRQGIQTCQRCTEMCSEDKNQMEVTPCTQESNRVCFCKPGFYCEERYNYETYCKYPCVACETGTFSSKPSLDSFCTRHKDCVRLGMTTLNVGNKTHDNECGYATPKRGLLYTPSSIINTINTASTLMTGSLVEESTTTQDGESVYSTTKMAASSTPSSNISTNTASTLRRVTRGGLIKEDTAKHDGENVYTTTKMEPSSIPSSTINATYTNTTSTLKRGSLVEESTTTHNGENVYSTTKMAASSIPSSTINTIYTNAASILREGTAQPIDQDKEKSEFHWLLLLILLLMLLFMAGFCMLMKGLIKGKHEEQQHSIAGDHQILSNSQSNISTDMETKIPLGNNVREVKGQNMEMTPQSGVVRQVTVEHNGRGENVNNTVGSIYIYSPGTVILGSNSGDKKEEAGVCEEARPLIGSPQQESNPPSQEVRIRMSAQEEAKEELSLSFPVPATGK
ncbi:uncharacterized protein si:dkeyp-61b2.1 isoform X2 [Megalobrama amblycephala]|uniref:uncharacterized protein si:dkeyp-61b2.1 isoform X2 n=1 Tax=Megalobrama amblycephala TaxID=75352 RepID=UPI00201457EB|nr:uncharacterized protein si:dkeyp-61b2.1 isoform X2 [Megalobrama amblycephala]